MKPPEGETPIDRCARLAKERDAYKASAEQNKEAYERVHGHLVARWEALKTSIRSALDDGDMNVQWQNALESVLTEMAELEKQ